MRLRTLLIPAAGVVAAIALATPAQAGEITGSGKPTQGPAHANSICVFSGLEDGGEGGPSGPGVPPQNWGHSKEEFGATPAERKATGFQPGDSCNGHSGFLVNPPPGEP